MRYKTLARILLKLLGVYLIALAIPHFVSGTVDLVLRVIQGWNPTAQPSLVAIPIWYLIQSQATFVLQLFIGLYFVFGGKWVVNRLIPSNRPYCHECGYELTGTGQTGTCPECGTAYSFLRVGQ